MTTGVVGVGEVLPAGRPLRTLTMMLGIVLPAPRTRRSLGCGVPPCIFAQLASAVMSIGLRFGTLPSYVTVPVIVAAKSVPPAKAAARATAIFGVTSRRIGVLLKRDR